MDIDKLKRKSNIPLEDISFCEIKEDPGDESDSTNDVDFCGLDTDLKEINEIREWVIVNKIPHAHVDKLLKILRARLSPSLPTTTEKLLKNNYVQCNVDPLNEYPMRAKRKSVNTNPAVPKNPELSSRKADYSQSADDIEVDSNVPILQISNVQFKNDFERVLKELTLIKAEINEVKKLHEETTTLLLNIKVAKVANWKIDFEQKYNITLPIGTLEEFLQFDTTLKENQDLKNDVCLELMTCIDKDFALSRSFVAMLKKFMNKDVALQFTTVRKSSKYNDQNKQIFKRTEFSKCIDGIMLSKRNSEGLWTDEKDLITAMSDVLCNAKNWNKTKISNFKN